MNIKYFLSIVILLLSPISAYSDEGLESNQTKFNNAKQSGLKTIEKCKNSIILDDLGRQVTLTGNIVIKGAGFENSNILANNISKCLKSGKKNETWIQIKVIHGDKTTPVVGAPYTLIFSDRSVIKGKLDAKGQMLHTETPTTIIALFIGEDTREWQPYVKHEEIPNPLYIP